MLSDIGGSYWLLTLKIAGVDYVFTEAARVIPYGSETIYTSPGLGPVEFDEEVEAFSQTSSSREASVEVSFSHGNRQGWVALASPKNEAGQLEAVLYVLLDGDDWADRVTVIKGTIDGMEHGLPEEPVSMTIAQNSYDDPSVFPPPIKVTGWAFPKFVYTGTNFGHDDAVTGQQYPFVFGSPGAYKPEAWWGFDDNAGVPATPALPIEIDLDTEADAGAQGDLLVCGHEVYDTTPGSVGRGSVHITSSGWPNDGYAFSYFETILLHRADAKGRGYTYASAPAIRKGDQFYVSWTGATGLPNYTGTGPLTGAGDIISYLLEHSTVPVDRLQTRESLAQVNGYAFDFYCNEERGPLDVIRDDLLPFIPLTMIQTTEGVAFIFWKWDATSLDAVAHIDEDLGYVNRVSPVEISPMSEIYNELAISFAPNADSGSYAKTLTYTSNLTDTAQDEQFNPYSFASSTKYGVRVMSKVECPTVHQDSTATAILDWMVRYYGQPRRTVSYEVGPELRHLKPGDVVTLTDSHILINNAVCLVTSASLGPGLTRLTLTTVPDWTTDLD